MRRFTTVLVPVMATMASLFLVACGNDGSTSDVGAASVTVPTSVATTATSGVDATVDTTVEAPVGPADAAPLLIDALPEISGPTVLWFWAPG